MSDGISQLNLFENEEIKGERVDVKQKRMQSFGDVEEETITIDEDMLGSLQSQELDHIVEIIEPGTLEEKTRDNVILSELQQRDSRTLQQPAESELLDSIESSDTTASSQPLLEKDNHLQIEKNGSESTTQTPAVKNADLADLAAEMSGKLEKVGTKSLSISKKLVILSLSLYQDDALYRKFEKGDLVLAGDFLYLLYQDELMVYKYNGIDENVLIPDYVGDLPVRYLYKGFLSKNFIDNHKVRGFLNYFKEDNVLDLSVDNLKSISKGVKSVQLPVELVHLPRHAFSGCYALKSLVIPPSVKVISPKAFEDSGITDLYFQGVSPKNCEALNLALGTNVYCYQQYLPTFQKFITEANKKVNDYKAEMASLEEMRQQVSQNATILQQSKGGA